MVAQLILFALAVVLICGVWLAHRHLARARRPHSPRAPRSSYPSLTVIRPIKGLDTEAAENIRAALDHGYPGPIETIFVFDDSNEPALPLVQAELAKAPPGAARVIFSGSPPANRTGKLHAMIAGLRRARGELVAFADSDIRPDRQALRALVDTLLDDPQAGSAFAPAIATRPARTVGDAGYALLLDGLYAPAAAAAAERHGGTLPFIMGQFMVFRREALRAIGGLECADGQLVDDMYLGMRVVQAGYCNHVSPHPVPIIQQGTNTRAFAGTYLRWITFSRSGLPGIDFKLSGWLYGIVFWTGLLGALLSLLAGLPLAALALSAIPIAVSASINQLHQRAGGAPLALRHLGVSYALLLAAPVVYLWIFGRREVVWRGRRYRLDAGSRLRTTAAEAPASLAANERSSL